MSEAPRIVNGLKLPPKKVIHTQRGGDGTTGQPKPGAVKFDFNKAASMADIASEADHHGFWSFEGRSTRGDWWLMYAAKLVGYLVGSVLIYGASQAESLVLGILGGLIFLFSVIMCVPVDVRRLHDRGLSGWIALLIYIGSCIPYINAVVVLVMFVVLGCLDGDIGENEYGPDPKGRAGSSQPRRLNLGTPSAVQATGGTANITVNVSEQHRPLPKDSLTEMLEKLGSLKERGLLTEEEFERQKEKILEQM